MSIGSYILGSTVKIPLQVSGYGVTPIIEKIIKPSGSVESGLPASMSSIDADSETYSYSYVPATAGDYIVIISTQLLDQPKQYHLEHFTVQTESRGVPRAESR